MHFMAFYNAANNIDQDTAIFSSTRQARNHDDYKKIVKAGDVVVSMLIERIITGKAHWWVFSALHEITGANPIDPDHAGKYGLICGDWIKWGRENNKCNVREFEYSECEDRVAQYLISIGENPGFDPIHTLIESHKHLDSALNLRNDGEEVFTQEVNDAD